jgi:hypothetical protein
VFLCSRKVSLRAGERINNSRRYAFKHRRRIVVRQNDLNHSRVTTQPSKTTVIHSTSQITTISEQVSLRWLDIQAMECVTAVPLLDTDVFWNDRIFSAVHRGEDIFSTGRLRIEFGEVHKNNPTCYQSKCNTLRTFYILKGNHFNRMIRPSPSRNTRFLL